MTSDDTKAGVYERPQDAGAGDAGVVKRWRAAIDLADREEKAWRERAKKIREMYRGDDGKQSFNLLRSNVNTVRPSLFNSPPVPDIRRRFGDPDPIARDAAAVLERCITISLDDGHFADALLMAVHDRQLIGRGVCRVRYEPVMQGEQLVYQQCRLEHVQWDRFRRGPGCTWGEVPWIAFRHSLTRQELVDRFGAEVGERVTLSEALAGAGNDEEKRKSDLFRRAPVWEVWDRDGREVLFIAADSHDSGPLARFDDPLRLQGFFPVPAPMYWGIDSASLVPMVEYDGYEKLASEAEWLTRRIGALLRVLKWRGVYDGALPEIADVVNKEDGDLVPVQNARAWAEVGGFERAIWLWPIEKVIVVLRELYAAREQTKQAIYEVTGISDILRGASDPDETLGAQQIKAQFGTQKIAEAQRDVQRFARDAIRLKAEIIAEHYAPEVLTMQSQVQVTPEIAQMIRGDALRTWRIDIETDSTIQADVSRAQQQVGAFVQGFAQFVQAIGPAVQAGVVPLDSATDMLSAFARLFKLGRQAEDAIERIGQQPQQQAPDPAAEAEKAKQQFELAKMQREDERSQREHAMEMERMDREQQVALMDHQLKLSEAEIRVAEGRERLKMQAAGAALKPQGAVQ